MMDPALELVIGTSTKTGYLTPNTINLYDNLDARTALSFQLRLPSSATRPDVGQPVYLSAGSTRVFGGTLDNYTETLLNPLGGSGGLYLMLNCNCVDFSQLIGKRRVYKSYVSSGLGEYDLVATTNAFTGDGITRTWSLTYPVQTTPSVTINGFAASVAPVGAASTFGYYYTLSSNFILGNTSNTAPASTDAISVVYSAIVGKPAYDSDIIADINTNFLNGEGITTTDYVSAGIRISELNFNYVPANEALNTICDITGRTWYVDPYKRLHYFARTENNAPFNINSTSNNWRSCTVKRSRDKYRNKEYVLNSFGLLLSTESFTGDGQTRTFTAALPVYSQPLIKINGYTATVGIANASASTYGYYWSKESRQIYSNTTNSALASTDTLTIEYAGLYPVVTVSADGEEIANRATIESNSGIYEEIATANKTYALDAALDYGAAIVAKYGKPLDEVSFETDIDGLAAGQLININLPNSNLNDYYLITSVSGHDIGMATLRYRVTACSGLDRGGWASFFRSLVTGINPIYTEPYENLAQLKQVVVSGNIKFTDEITITSVTITIAYYDTAVYDTGVYV